MPAACEQERILSVTELTDRMRRTLEGTFPFVWVRGEIGELSFPGSGHIYFTLKDAGAQLQCVWFRDRQMRGRNFDPLTGEIFAEPRPDPVRLLRQGSELFCAGQISVYGPRGRYQLIVELVQAGGQGLLAQAFEERKQALAARGFFAAERKRPLPASPSRVALVTSPAGAAIHDFMELTSVRGLGAEVRLFPVRVQGEGAAGQICRALDIPMELLPTRTLLVPHAREVLDDLHGRYTLSIVSNGFVEVQYRKIRNSGIAGYFDHIVLSEEAGALKPDKRIFEHALRLNAARPDEALMVGDLYQADIAGAQNASIDQAYFNWRGTPLPPANAPTYTIRSLRELMEIL